MTTETLPNLTKPQGVVIRKALSVKEGLGMEFNET
jgi:hypothetical protein